jgi:hypothetical protein
MFGPPPSPDHQLASPSSQTPSPDDAPGPKGLGGDAGAAIWRFEKLNGQQPMASNLFPLCESLLSKVRNEPTFMRTLLDYLVLVGGEKLDICKYARDPALPQFIEITLLPFAKLSASSPPEFLGSLVEISSFYKRWFALHPAFLDCAAATFPLDIVLPNAVSHRENELIRPVCELAALICQSSISIVKTASAAKTVCDCFRQLVDAPGLAGSGITIVAGLVRHSPVFVTFVRSSADLRRFRSILSTALSGDDHLSALGSVAALLFLFPRSIETESARVVGLHGIGVCNDNLLMLKGSGYILTDVAREGGLTGDDFARLLQTARTSVGVKSFLLFEIINHIVANGGMPLIGEDFNVEAIARFIFGQNVGFVALSAVRFVQQLNDHLPNLFDRIEDSESLFVKGLEIACSPSSTCDIDLIECVIVMLRLITCSSRCFEQVRGLLESSEEKLFVAFQRNIEANESFASLGMFWFIMSCAAHLAAWKRRLGLVVVDTQFSALLAHLLERSTDRTVLRDTIQALSIIATFSSEADSSDRELLFDNLVSGFSVVNSHQKKETTAKGTCLTNKLSKHESEMTEMRGHLEIQELELQSALHRAKVAEQRVWELEGQLEELRQKVTSSGSDLAALQKKFEAQSEELRQANENRDRREAESHDQALSLRQSKEVIQDLKQQQERFFETDRRCQELERANGQLTERLKTMETSIEDYRTQVTQKEQAIENQRSKVKEVRAALKERIASVDDNRIVREKMTVELGALRQKIEDDERRRDGEKEQMEGMRNKVREKQKTIDRYRDQEGELRRELLESEQRYEAMSKEVAELKASQKNWELIIQFLHRITDGSPLPPSDVLASIFDDL